MAFFATVDTLPLARMGWNPKERGKDKPKRPNPPVRPPRGNPPRPTQPQRYCKQGRLPMLIPMPDMSHREWRCSPIPYAYLQFVTQDQIRGWPKPSRTPLAVTEDRRFVPAYRRSPYHQATAKDDLNENVEGN
jgi:hypothetical protein